MIVHYSDEQILRDVRVRKRRQIMGTTVALLLILALAVLYKRPDLFGVVFTSHAIFGGQITVIGAFIVFSALNLRCPVCGKYVGPDVRKRDCPRCGSRLQ